MGYMHSKSIGHLSLTPCDILFTRPGGSEVKICDFSLAKRIVGVVKMEFGQPEYVAPEIVNGEGATFASDMWSIGIITYLMLSGVSPFRGQNDRETLQRIQMGDIDFDFELWQNISRYVLRNHHNFLPTIAQLREKESGTCSWVQIFGSREAAW